MSEYLTNYIKDLISSKGKITFEEFVDLALYHEDTGYYNSCKPKIGVEGDFYTSPDVHPFMGRVLAVMLYEMWGLLDRCDFTIVEMGAGKGRMALDILNEINAVYPDFYSKVSYLIIEKSKTFKVEQQDLLVDHAGTVKWADSLKDSDGVDKIAGCVLSNELIDAFPFHRVCMVGNELKEIYVACDNGGFVEEIHGLSTPDLLDYVKRLKLELPDGYKTEINLEAMRWIKDVSTFLDRGFIITIDYGHPAYSYYDPARHKGTFLCYHNHTTNENPFERIGEQDITAHVDFTSLAQEGTNCGLELEAFMELWSFFLQYGSEVLEQEMNKLQNSDQIKAFKSSSAIKNLIHPEGMGGKFKVLIQSRNVSAADIVASNYNKKHILAQV